MASSVIVLIASAVAFGNACVYLGYTAWPFFVNPLISFTFALYFTESAIHNKEE